MKIILASKSPRRIEILRSLGLAPEIMPADADENISGFENDPEGAVLELAKRKAQCIREIASPDSLIIAADTLVCFENKILGKPADEKEAEEMLRSLSGSRHFVYTGLCVMYGGKTARKCEKTTVFFCDISDSEIKDYIKTKEPLDKAGAYGIQGKGGIFVSGIEGDYFNVVGLPVYALFELIKKELSLSFFELTDR